MHEHRLLLLLLFYLLMESEKQPLLSLTEVGEKSERGRIAFFTRFKCAFDVEEFPSSHMSVCMSIA